MTEQNNICGNCGTPLTIQDGKIVCPNCGTEYAADWGHEDVARAKIETEHEREQAQLDRDRVINETREQITRQQDQDSQRRARRRESQGFEIWLIRTGVLVASFFMMFFLFRACTFLVSRNYGTVSKTLFGEDVNSKTAKPYAISKTKIDEQLLLADANFLREAYASQVYVITNLTDREIVPDGTDKTFIYTGDYEYECGYLIYTDNGRTELFEIFALDYRAEDGSGNMKVYIPVYLAMAGVREDGKISCDYKARQYKGTLGRRGFTDKDIILDVYTASWDNVTETVPFDIPEKIRGEV